MTRQSTRNVAVAASAVFLLGACDGASSSEIEGLASEQGALNATSAANHPGPFTTSAKPGLVAGTTTWVVPSTPNGLENDQSWFSIAGAPDGNVYVGACDHTTNSALYRLTTRNDLLGYVGDARAASEAVGNWLPGETAEKFHMRPLWYRGQVYVATADYSNQDDLYLNHRGFHWYAYNSATKEFSDLSVSEPNGVGAEHISIFSAVLDEARGVIYGLGSPNSNLYRYDIASGQTTDLGRSPLLTRKYYNPGRYIWLDSDGRVYMTVATAGTLAPGEPATPLYPLTWDPVTGWGAEPTWAIKEMLRTGQCTPDGKRCYILDYKLNLFRFDDDANTWTYLKTGVIDGGSTTGPHYSQRIRGIRVRSTNLSANEKKIYFVNDSATESSVFEWDFAATDTPTELVDVNVIDPELVTTLVTGYRGYTGHDSWDLKGRFHVAGFGGEEATSPNVKVLRVDPVRMKAALGFLPGVPEVSIRGRGPGLHLVRTGDRSTNLNVLLSVDGSKTYQTVSMPAGKTVVHLSLSGDQCTKDVTVIPDGDTYVVK